MFKDISKYPGYTCPSSGHVYESLSEALELHGKYTNGQVGGRRMILPADYDLRRANLSDANDS